MKSKSMIMLLLAILMLSACGKAQLDDPLTLMDQDKNEVTFPSDKPSLFFFITTYT
ncbi:hypothetical protein [Peribacillus sp. SCS-155]|uniref:hypothetical protein n=1 Tax=Peribacillus sedimenti TaxID=3115297 RepID=UPI0039057AF4